MVIVPAVELPEYPPVMSATFRLSMTVLTVVVMVVGCAGSVCVIALFLSDRCLWKPSYVLIGFLAFVDLLNLGCWGTLKVCFLVRDCVCLSVSVRACVYALCVCMCVCVSLSLSVCMRALMCDCV